MVCTKFAQGRWLPRTESPSWEVENGPLRFATSPSKCQLLTARTYVCTCVCTICIALYVCIYVRLQTGNSHTRTETYLTCGLRTKLVCNPASGYQFRAMPDVRSAMPYLVTRSEGTKMIGHGRKLSHIARPRRFVLLGGGCWECKIHWTLTVPANLLSL